MSFLAPLFFVGLAAVAVPIFVHLIQRERKDIIEFPSLMFLQRIPYQSVERRRIHNWFLLLLRIGAMALVVAAFSRPFFTSTAATAVGSHRSERSRHPPRSVRQHGLWQPLVASAGRRSRTVNSARWTIGDAGVVRSKR
jgi:hypothetical protein